MKEIINNKSINKNLKHLGLLIDDFLVELRIDSDKNQQKILELCHVGKFLMLLETDYTIDKLDEGPDFILKNNYKRIGIEHQIIIDQDSKAKEGFFENVCTHAERELRQDKDLPNFLANIYFEPYLNRKINDKKKYTKEICRVVKHYVLNEVLLESDIIESVHSMDHSQINVNANLGAWWQKEITEEIIQNAINKKEEKIESYISNTSLPQWLLLVIGGTGESSYIFENKFEPKLETRFEKVFLLEDFYNKLYELK